MLSRVYSFKLGTVYKNSYMFPLVRTMWEKAFFPLHVFGFDLFMFALLNYKQTGTCKQSHTESQVAH